jgi:hypothetical protein
MPDSGIAISFERQRYAQEKNEGSILTGKRANLKLI